MKQKLVILADSHNKHNQITIPPCDILIHAGDWTGTGKPKEVKSFDRWLRDQSANFKVFICGNHELTWDKAENLFKKQMVREWDKTGDIIYLEDNSITINGLKIYGSPFTPRFFDWAFLLDRNSKELTEKWWAIPDDTDVLVTHGPPFGVLDKVIGRQDNLGCELLEERVDVVQPKIHCFGHIHTGRGIDNYSLPGTTFINASVLNEQYKLVYEPIEIEI